MTHQSPEASRPWLRRWLYLERGLLAVLGVVLAGIWWILPEESEGRGLVQVGMYFVFGLLATSISVKDELRYRAWRDRQRRWPWS